MSQRLNFMPWRERQRLQTLKRFQRWLLGAMSLALMAVLLVDRLAYQRTQQQAQASEGRALALEALDAQIQDMARLGQSLRLVEQRISTLASLRARQETVPIMLVEIEQAMPAGMQLTGLDLQGEQLAITGLAVSPAVLAQFMRDLARAPVLHELELKHVEGAADGDRFLLAARLGLSGS